MFNCRSEVHTINITRSYLCILQYNFLTTIRFILWFCWKNLSMPLDIKSIVWDWVLLSFWSYWTVLGKCSWRGEGCLRLTEILENTVRWVLRDLFVHTLTVDRVKYFWQRSKINCSTQNYQNTLYIPICWPKLDNTSNASWQILKFLGNIWRYQKGKWMISS